MNEVAKLKRLAPEHRFISNKEVACECGDVTLSSQQIVIFNGWLNDE